MSNKINILRFLSSNNNKEQADNGSRQQGKNSYPVMIYQQIWQPLSNQGFDIMESAEVVEAVNVLGIELNGEYEMEGLSALQAVADGNTILIAHDVHSEGDNVVDAFNSQLLVGAFYGVLF